jgi:hypothetical protein
MIETINPKSKLKATKPKLFEQLLEDDPLSGLANFVDVMLVFAVGLMLAIVTYYSLSELLSEEEITLIKNPNKPNMEIIKKTAEKLEKYKITTQEIGGEGQRIGVVYRLKTGEMVYVPEEPSESKVGEE